MCSGKGDPSLKGGAMESISINTVANIVTAVVAVLAVIHFW